MAKFRYGNEINYGTKAPRLTYGQVADPVIWYEVRCLEKSTKRGEPDYWVTVTSVKTAAKAKQLCLRLENAGKRVHIILKTGRDVKRFER